MFKLILIGLASGIISGLFGAGGGLIIVPSLIHILKKDERTARGTATFIILPLVITSSIFYMKNSYMDWSLSSKVIIGGIIGRIYRCKTIKKIARNINTNIFYNICNICCG